MKRTHTYTKVVLLLIAVIFAGCKSQHYPDDAQFLTEVKVRSTDKTFDTRPYTAYVRQKPAAKIFSFIPRPWAKKVVVDSLETLLSCENIRSQMQNQGYLRASVKAEKKQKKEKRKNSNEKVEIAYTLTPGESFYINDFSMNVPDTALLHILNDNKEVLAPLSKGCVFSINNLSRLRKQVTKLFTDRGYYRFNKEYIDFNVDTIPGREDVRVRMNISLYKANGDTIGHNHPVYHINTIRYLSGSNGSSDSNGLNLRQKVLAYNTAFSQGDLYSGSALQRTYNNFARLQAVRYTNINFQAVPDTTLLDCDIQVSTNKSQTVSFMPEGTNTAGDFGAAGSVTYENRNLFHGSEVFSLSGRVAFEAITGLEDYDDKFYQEYSVEAKLNFPQLLVPFMSGRIARKSSMSTEFALRYDIQNRPEFHRQVMAASLRYKWSANDNCSLYRLDVLDLNYVRMPWISTTFRENYLEDNTSRNAILRYNYEDLFIMKAGIGYTLNKTTYALRLNFETAGNFLSLLSHATHFPKNSEGQYKVFSIAFAQYVKADLDYAKRISFDERNQLALHVGFGIAYPYGNSQILPFEKRYFSGGANSLRGWSVRSLGPGRFKGTDGRIDFINQTGDMKLDLNIEHRTKLFWKFSGAVFIDAGNIWTLRNYKDQPGGKFSITTFWKEIAASYGIGLRLDLSYFILRLDAGMKAINPAYYGRDQFPVYHPSISRDGALHFAVGLPF